MKNKYSKVIYITENNLTSAWIKSIGIDVIDCPKHPLKDFYPHEHLMDEHKRAKKVRKHHLTPPTTAP